MAKKGGRKPPNWNVKKGKIIRKFWKILCFASKTNNNISRKKSATTLWTKNVGCDVLIN